jgi:ATP-dependent Clp protease ATP-binding subunit ClpC
MAAPGDHSIALPKAGCSFCGYDLSGNASGVCPECGRPVYRFTDRAREVITEANRQAILLLGKNDPRRRTARWWLPQSTSRPEINPYHILLGIVGGPHGIAYHAIQSCGAETEQLHDSVVRRLPRCDSREFPDGARLPLSRPSQAVIKIAVEEALQLNHNWVGTEHLLLALCRQPGDITVKRALAEANVVSDRVRAFIVANMTAANTPGAP